LGYIRRDSPENVEKGLEMFYVVLVVIAAVLLAALFFVRGRTSA
jgi:hypothetical protein